MSWWDSLLQSDIPVYVLVLAALAGLVAEGLSAFQTLEQLADDDTPPVLVAGSSGPAADGSAGRPGVRGLRALRTSEPGDRPLAHHEHEWRHIGGGLYQCRLCGMGGGDAFATPRDPVLTRDQARDDVRKRLAAQQEGRR